MHKPARGQLPEGLESCWADFPTDVLFCLWTFQSQLPRVSSSQDLPRPSGVWPWASHFFTLGCSA